MERPVRINSKQGTRIPGGVCAPDAAFPLPAFVRVDCLGCTTFPLEAVVLFVSLGYPRAGCIRAAPSPGKLLPPIRNIVEFSFCLHAIAAFLYPFEFHSAQGTDTQMAGKCRFKSAVFPIRLPNQWAHDRVKKLARWLPNATRETNKKKRRPCATTNKTSSQNCPLTGLPVGGKQQVVGSEEFRRRLLVIPPPILPPGCTINAFGLRDGKD
jgi:hypothetical protein